MPTVALHIIAKDQVDEVSRLAKDYGKYFTEIDVAWDNENCAVDKVNNYYYKWSDKEKERGYPNFDDKRNFLVKNCKCDYYFRLDTDDELVTPEKIPQLVSKMDTLGVHVLACFYNYSRDEFGNCHAGHNRETIVKNNGLYKWNKNIHENIIPIDGGRPNIAVEKEFIIVHNLDKSHAKDSQARNLKFLFEEYEATKDNPDPRTLAYLGRMLYPIGEKEKAKFFLQKHIEMSGWDEDRYMSWVMLADIYNDLGDFKSAIACCNEALAERHDFPEAYLKLHELYYQAKQWDKAIHWGKIGLAIKRPDSFTLIDPSAYTWRPAISMAYCYLMINDPENAYKFFSVAMKSVPTLDWVVENKKTFEDAVVYKNYLDKFLWMLNMLKDRDGKKVESLFHSIPEEMKHHDVLIRLKHQHTPPRKWGKDEIAIFCGQAWEDWAAPSVLKGIGGSEEAVVYLAQELTKLGWKVTVFNSCGEMAGTYSGVTYKYYPEFSPYDDYNIVVAWRLNLFAHDNLRAKKKIVWLHDVPQKELLPKSEIHTYDNLVVLSEYHKSLLPDYIPAEKVYVSRNGINKKDFELVETPKREPHRIIYTSSYDRGIEHLLFEWKNIRKEVPDAELHLFYGWNTYLEMMNKGARPRKFYDWMSQLMNQEGVFEHGRVGHKQLVKEFYKSAIYAYPSHFEEISCISAMKAQACGCVPVVTNYAALKETIKAGVRVDGKGGEPETNYRFRDEIIELLKNQDNQEELRKEVLKHKGKFWWEDVAKDWSSNLFPLKRNQYKDYEDYKKYYVTHGDFKRTNLTEDGTILLQKRYQFVIDNVKELGLKSLIDVGASDGAMCYALNELCGIRADGIEADEKCVQFANKYAYENKYQSQFWHGLAEEITPAQKYEAVSALEILEHVIDPKVFLEKIESFTQKGGYVFISTPDKDGYFGESNFNPQHIHHFTKESLAELIGKDRIIKWGDTPDLLTVMYRV